MSLEPVDLSGYFKVGREESQLYDVASSGVVGPNKLYDCVPASFAICLMALGRPDIEPQDLMDMVYGKGHVGGADFVYFTNRLRALGVIPAGLDVLNVNPWSTVQAIHDYLVQGFPVIVEFKDNLQAQLVPQWDSAWHGTHASVAVACGPRTISILNVWDGSIQTFSHAVFSQATFNPAGNLVVFQRSVRPAPPPAPPPPVVPAPAPLPAPAPTPEPLPDPVPVIPSPPVTPPVVPEPAPKPPDPPQPATTKGRLPLLVHSMVGYLVGLVALFVALLSHQLSAGFAGIDLGAFFGTASPVVGKFLGSPNGLAVQSAIGWVALDALMTGVLAKRLGYFNPRQFSAFISKLGGEGLGILLLAVAGYISPMMEVIFGLAVAAFIYTESTGAKTKIQLFLESFSKLEPTS